ncbi:butyrophilin subfamily 2 member A2-like [Alosa pseudoharengus]|uniref:butyrophilin subfamily 2 member A2-like n=1 Tax=Alosa pseudoharengus TaxID=34774 RepID=UPI003F8A8F63
MLSISTNSRDQKIQNQNTNPEHQSRVSLTGSLKEGGCVPQIRPPHTGRQRRIASCIKQRSNLCQNVLSSAHSLFISAIGSLPNTSVTAPERDFDYVNVSCVSSGWFPKPTVIWRDSDLERITQNYGQVHWTDNNGLVSVSSWLLVSPSESEWVSCSVGLSDQHRRESWVDLSSSAGPWRMCFGIILFLTPMAIFVSALYSCCEFILNIKRRKVKLTLDLDMTIPPYLTMIGNATGVKCSTAAKIDNVKEQLPIVLCCEKFSSGQYYWEVMVSNIWYAGVCSDSAEREQGVLLTPQNGFWVLQYDGENGLYVNTDPWTVVCPQKQIFKLGLFLDCDQHTLSFYDVDSGSHLCIMVVSDTKVIPLIGPGTKDPIRLC